MTFSRPARIWVLYCGYCWAMSAAPAKDIVSWFWTLVGDGRPRRRTGQGRSYRCRISGRQERAEDRLHDRPAEVALEVGRAGRHPGAAHRYRTRQRLGCRRAGKPHADADEHIAESDDQ